MQLFKKKAYTLYYENECLNCIEHDVTIGTQIWTGCNLSVTTYRNGDTIPQVTDPAAWESLTTGAWCHYNNDPANDAIYGKLYNWYAVNDPRVLAPTGYHVPSDAEWTTLTTFLGGESVAGGKLKEVGLCHWLSPNTDATDQVLFTALPGGARNFLGTSTNIGVAGNWWSSSEANTTSAIYINMAYNFANTVSPANSKEYGFSVRLLQNIPFDIEVSSLCSGGGAVASMNIVLGTGVEPYSSAIAVFNSEAAALANTTWALGTNSVSVGVDPSIVATYWLAAKDSEGTIVTKSVNVNCAPPVDPIDMDVFQTCSGTSVTYVGADTITGGVAPYYKANTYFTSESAALANTSWSSTPNDGSVAFDYAAPGFGTYWIAIKDSDDTVFAKGFYADCWNSVAATRTSADLSANSYFSSAGACGSSSTQNIYIAYRNPGILSNGDRVFTTASGNTPFNGMVVSELDNWWKFNDPGTYSACVLGTAVRIDNAGYITDVSCC